MTSKGNAACVFDAYGTLFNVHSAVAKHANSLGKGAAEISNVWRAKQLDTPGFTPLCAGTSTSRS